MEILENKQNQEKTFSESQVNLLNRSTLSISGVEKVYETNESKVQIKVAGSNLQMLGEGLNIEKLDVEQGLIQINGLINELKYSTGEVKGGLFKKIFKWVYFIVLTTLLFFYCLVI